MGGLTVFSDGVQALIEKGHRKITPFFIPYAITNMGSALLAIDLGFMGPNYSISTACATSNYCFYAAANHIRRGEADLMLAGGTEAAIIPIGLGGFVACRALSQRNDDPQTASRPWDKDRDGFVMGEGAGVLVSSHCYHTKGRVYTYLFLYFCLEFVGQLHLSFSAEKLFVSFLLTYAYIFFLTGDGELGTCNETRCTDHSRVLRGCC